MALMLWPVVLLEEGKVGNKARGGPRLSLLGSFSWPRAREAPDHGSAVLLPSPRPRADDTASLALCFPSTEPITLVSLESGGSEEFPGGLVVKDPSLSLLWLRLDPWPRTSACCEHGPKMK